MRQDHLLGVGLGLLNSLLLGLGERRVEAEHHSNVDKFRSMKKKPGYDLFASLHHQEQLVASLSAKGFLVVDSFMFCSNEVFYLINSLASSWFRWNTSWPENQHFIKISSSYRY